MMPRQPTGGSSVPDRADSQRRAGSCRLLGVVIRKGRAALTLGLLLLCATSCQRSSTPPERGSEGQAPSASQDGSGSGGDGQSVVSSPGCSASSRDACKARLSRLIRSITEDWESMLACFDEASAGRLRATAERAYPGDPSRFLRLLYELNHPARYRSPVRVEGHRLVDGDCWLFLTRTGPYRYLDATYTHPMEEKPVELWLRFVEGPEGPVISSEYPFNDLIYMLQ